MEIRKLNALRGIAALIVVFSHFANFSRGPLHQLLNDSGQVGVMLFFVLSGFLMSVLYLERPCDRGHVRGYALARAGRVMPLYIIVVGLSFLLWQLGLVGYLYQVDSAAVLASHLLFFYGNSVLWTIPAEMLFYGLFLLLWWCYQRRPPYFYLACVASLLLVIIFKFPRPRGDLLGIPFDIQFFRALPFFISGLLLGQLYRHWPVPGYLCRKPSALLLLLIPFLFPEVFAAITGNRYLVWINLEVVALVAAAFFAVVFLVPDSNRLLANPLGDFFGRISYSLYLLHLPVLALVKRMELGSTALSLAVFLGLAVLLSWLSYRLVENPLRLWIRGWGGA
ncbi:acyltransferase family protein [Haliea sp. E17]|uniref:acyltransferase family protein n=1 Tax=Haliea sp. E17 TaxID=3401576 RepID=UPI003AB0823F